MGFEALIVVLMQSQSFFIDAVSTGIYRSYRRIGTICCLDLQGIDHLESGDGGI